MKSPCRNTALALMLCFLTGLFVPRADTEAKGQSLQSLPPSADVSYQMESLNTKVRELVLRYYPNATFERRGNRIRFASDAHAFLSPDDSFTTSLPHPHGLTCDIALLPNQMPSASRPSAPLAPAQFSSTLLSSPHSTALNAHIEISLQHPGNAPRPFLRDISDLADNFDELVKE